MPPVSWHDERRPTFRLGFGRGGQPSLSSYASGSSSWTLELGSRAPLRFSEVLSFDQSGGASGLGFSDNASSSSEPLTTFSDEAFVRNGVAPSAIGYDASLPRPGRPPRLNTPRYAADEASVRAILSLLAPEHGEAMRRAGEELDAAMVARWLQPRAGDAQATLRALRAHVAWRTDPRGPFLTSSSCDSSFSVSSSRASPPSSAPPSSSAPATPRDARTRSGSGSGDGVEGNGISGDGGPSLPPRGSSASGSGGDGGGRAPPPRRRGRRGGSERGSERGAGGGLLPAAGAGRVDPRSIPTCLAARKACLQGVDRAGRAVVLIRASRHFMGAGSTVEDNQRLMALVLDAAFAAADAGRNPARRLLCLFDLKGLRLANCDVKVLAGIFDMLKLHYPERLDAFWFLNAPTIFWALWRVVGPMVNPGTRAKIKFLRGREAASALAAAVPSHVLPHDLGGAAGSRDLPVEEAVEMMDRGEWPPARPLTAEEEREEEEERARSSSRKLLRSRGGGGGGSGSLGLKLGERGGLLLSARRQLQHLRHQHPPNHLHHHHHHSHLHHEQGHGGGVGVGNLRRRHSSAAATPKGGEEGEGEGEIAGGRRALFAAAFAAAFVRGGGARSSSLPATPRSPSSSSSSPLTPRSAASALLSAATARLSALAGNRKRLVEGQQRRQQQQQQQQQLLLQQAPPPSSAAGGLFALLAAVLVGVLSALASVRISAGAFRIVGRRKPAAALTSSEASAPSSEVGQGEGQGGLSRPLSPSSIKRTMASSGDSHRSRPLFRLTAVPSLTLAPLRRMLSSASSRGSSRASSRPSSAESSEPLTPPPQPPAAPAPPAASLSANVSPAATEWIPPRGTFSSSSEWLLYRGGAADEAAAVLHEMTMRSF